MLNDKIKEIVEEKTKELLDTETVPTNQKEAKGFVGNAIHRFIMGKMYILIAAAVALLLVIFLIWKNPFNWNFNLSGDLKIDKTENVVTQIKKISEFTTACYYQELVIKKEKTVASSLNSVYEAFNMGTDSCKCEIALIAKGKVRAGFDLSKMEEKDFTVKSDTLQITVPKAEIFDVIINPSGYEIYTEDGDWSHEEIVNIQSETAAILNQNAIKGGLLEKANTSGVDKLTTFFKSFGFNTVLVDFSK